jgi:hypothetical protein
VGVSLTENVIRFGLFELNLKSGQLRKNGSRIRISQQPVQVLALLLERPGEVVTREELRQRLWSPDTFVDFDHGLNKSVQALSRIDTSGEQAAKAVVYGLLQVLLATEVTLGCQDGGVPQKELYLLQFAAIHMAELCAGAPKIMRCEVVELQAPGTAPDYIPDGVLGNAGSPRSSVTADCPEHSTRRD